MSSIEIVFAKLKIALLAGLNYFFLAQDLSTTKNSPDQDEQISGFKFFRFDQVNDLIDQNLIPDLRNRACIWKAQLEIN